MNETEIRNGRLLSLLSRYLNFHSDYIKESDIREIAETGAGEEKAFGLILANAFGLDLEKNREDIEFFKAYFPYIFHQLNTEEFRQNPYYKNIHFPDRKTGNIEFGHRSYKPYEGFVCGDMEEMPDGRLLPHIGFFMEEFRYPIILEKGIEWMTVTPNEIRTLEEPVRQAHGKVLTFGLGIGYYPYMISLKDDVESIDIAERNENTIELFRRHILPQFQNRQKIRLISGDALSYIDTISDGQYDFIFADLWHDAGDGKPLYLKIKEYEKKYPNTEFAYWIEKTIKCYL